MSKKEKLVVEHFVVIDVKQLDDLILENSKLKQQIAEMQNTIDEINREFVQAVHDWKTLCKKKDKEISKLQASCQQDKIQLAIQELEEVEKACFNQKELVDFGNVACFMVDVADILEIINNQIKELKGDKDVKD